MSRGTFYREASSFVGSLHPGHDILPRAVILAAGLKIAQSMAMYWQARALKAAWLHERFPDWSEADVQAKVREIFLLATS